MQIRQKYIIFDKPTTTPLSYEIDFTKSDLLKIQVSGNGECNITVYGKIHPKSEYYPITIIQDSDYKFINAINSKGIYTISATGYDKLKIETKNADNTLTCVASEVVEV